VPDSGWSSGWGVAMTLLPLSQAASTFGGLANPSFELIDPG
jgi:hypothetical protein